VSMSLEKPLVSIITPSYNQGRFIEETLLSVRNQDYPNIEHIVVDGGSTDTTLEILKRYEDTYNLRWLSESDRGQSDAINKGFRMSKGEIIGWLNSDDVYFSRDVISYVVDKFLKLRDTAVIYGNSVDIDENSLILRTHYPTSWFSYRVLLLSDFIIQPSTFFRRAVVQEHELDISIDSPMDYEYWLRLAKNGVRFKHVDKILAAYRSHSATKTMSRWEEMKTQTRQVQERYGQKFNTQYHLFRFLNLVLLLLLRIYGVTGLIKMFLSPSKLNLAFDASFDSVFKAGARQLFYLFKF
jgi:glycosyltransferase involved in cell wall biosynthesis